MSTKICLAVFILLLVFHTRAGGYALTTILEEILTSGLIVGKNNGTFFTFLPVIGKCSGFRNFIKTDIHQKDNTEHEMLRCSSVSSGRRTLNYPQNRKKNGRSKGFLPVRKMLFMQESN